MNNLEWTYRNDDNGVRLEASDGTFEFLIERSDRILVEEHLLKINGKLRSSVVNHGAGRLIALANEISNNEREMRS